ncbi:MAG: serine hydrolase domain-containing protein [Gaiellales bacterium]
MTRQDPPLMQGLPPTGEGLVTLENWCRAPHLRWGFLHVREVVPTARIDRGREPGLELEHDPSELDGIAFAAPDGTRWTVGEMVERTFTDGFLVLHRGRIVTERYDNGMTPATTHLLQSVSKSIAGTVAGIVAGRCLLDPDAPASTYVTELAGTSFEGATVRHVLDMRTGTRYDETYDDPAADVCITEALAGWRPVPPGLGLGSVYDQILALENARPHGEVFDYRSILTELLAWILERATGTRYSELISTELWSRLGAEHDAEITIRNGVTLADGGICVTLRDLARFGLLHLREGEVEGRRIVPTEWVHDTRHGDAEARRAFAASEAEADHPGAMYRNQWWVLDPQRSIYTGLGIHGQFVYVHVPADVVCVKLSTWPVPLDMEKEHLCLAAFAAIADELGG